MLVLSCFIILVGIMMLLIDLFILCFFLFSVNLWLSIFLYGVFFVIVIVVERDELN